MRLPKDHALDENEIRKYGKKLKHFRNVYCIDNLPKRPWRNELIVLNLDKCSGAGTHWVSIGKAGDLVIYFNSFGNLGPNKEVLRYYKGNKILHNFDQYQNFNTYNCGQISLKFLEKFSHTNF